MESVVQAHLDFNFFTEEEVALVNLLVEEGQQHLFADWAEPGQDDEAKRSMIHSLARIHEGYPGGIMKYLANARHLLSEARKGGNPYAGYTPTKPPVEDLSSFNDNFFQREREGLEASQGLAVVLVAGGLGERLGYSGIKLDIPVEITRKTSYIELYCSHIQALEKRISKRIPLIIMTSDDTHEPTVELLSQNDYFGLSREQVYLLKQELVPALADNEARIAKEGPYQIQLKPHGHGDIHMLMYSSGLHRKLLNEGKTHLAFIQDTNGQVFHGLLPALGVSVKAQYDFNSLAVPRVPKESVGALTTLQKNNEMLTINVEYNQLDALLKETVNPDGDAPEKNGLSPFPGNINVLIAALPSYVEVLEQTKGIIAEFVNPKYTDEARTVFKKPTRLETMMQDLPKLFDSDKRVGVTVLERKWCFSPDKNNLQDAAKKADLGQPPESAASAESDYYYLQRKRLSLAGVRFDQGTEERYGGVPFVENARVILSPQFAVTQDELNQKVAGGYLASHSTLVVDGEEIYINNLQLMGKTALVLRTASGVRLDIENISLVNHGYHIQALSDEEMADPEVPDYLKIRAYRLIADAPLVIDIREPGHYYLDKLGKVHSKN